MIKFIIFLYKIYSFCKQKIDIFNLLFLLKKINNKKTINIIYFLINNLNFYKKKKLSCLCYLKISLYITNYNTIFFKKFFFSENNMFLYEIKNFYNDKELFLFNALLKKNFYLNNLKHIKKIYTNVLYKKKFLLIEFFYERFLITLLYTYLYANNSRNKKILNFYFYYNNNNFFFFLNKIKRVCSLINTINNEDISSKLYFGLLKNNKVKDNLTIFYHVLNTLYNNNKKKLELSLDIYNLNILNIIKKIKKINLIKILLFISIPDLFIEFFFKKKLWCLFDSKIIKEKYNYYIQNSYDEYIGIGNFRINFFKILKNNKIFKVLLNPKKILIKIYKNVNFKLIFVDSINRNNVNKHISNLFPNFYHSKIFDRNNFFKKNYYFYKNENIFISKNNSFYLEIRNNFFFYNCYYNKKNFFLLYKLLEMKNEFSFINKEINFYLNFRTRPFIIDIFYKYFYNIKKEYINFNLINFNCYFSNISEPYCFYIGNEISLKNYFYKNNFLTNLWNKLIARVENNGIRNSFYLNFKKKNEFKIIPFDNFVLKKIFLIWQKKNEKFKF